MRSHQPYLMLDEKQQALDFLSQSLSFLAQADQNPFFWKWFAIAFDGAIYAFMVLALRNTDNSGVWQNEEKMRDEDGYIVVDDNSQLIGFKTAFKYIQNPERMGGYINAKPYSPENLEAVEKALLKLHEDLRNQLIHFQPMHWGVTPAYIANICLPLIELIEFLGLRSGRVHLREPEMGLIKHYLEAIKSLLEFHKNSEPTAFD